ncbi:MAG: dUTP diphosphatase, partial [Flavobacteriaceae bacterium]
MQLPVINDSPYDLPAYATVSSAGLDLKAVLDQPINLQPLERKIIGTGLKIALPEGYEAQVRPRSGLALKNSITVLNTPGTIDSDYRGEICVILINHGQMSFKINRGMRIAQIIFKETPEVNL